LTHIPTISDPNRYWWIAVSNWHLAVKRGFSVVRINRLDGGVDIFDHDPSEWHVLPGGPDVAAIPLTVGSSVHKIRGVGPSMYLTKEWNRAEDHRHINVGDDVFMIGRFIDYDGVETNKPSLRFGNISIMEAPVPQTTGHAGQSLVLDMHSRTGFSGSPVFVYRTSGSYFGEVPDGDIWKAEMWLGHTMMFLGLHWGQFPEAWQLREKGAPKEKQESNVALVTDGKYVEGMSGMTLVIPAETVWETLTTMPTLKKQLAEKEKSLKSKTSPSAPIAEGADKEDHRERFNRLKELAVKPPKSSD
jgi:hypothetical protein